jgi:hypothetical protein
MDRRGWIVKNCHVFAALAACSFWATAAHSQELPPDRWRAQLETSLFSARTPSVARFGGVTGPSTAQSPTVTNVRRTTGLVFLPSMSCNPTNDTTINVVIPYSLRYNSAENTRKEGIGDVFLGVTTTVFSPASESWLPVVAIGLQGSAPSAARGFGSGRRSTTQSVILSKSISDQVGWFRDVEAFAMSDYTSFIGATRESIRPDYSFNYSSGIQGALTSEIQMSVSVGNISSAVVNESGDGARAQRQNMQILLSGIYYAKGVTWIQLTVSMDQTQSVLPGYFGAVRFVALSF